MQLSSKFTKCTWDGDHPYDVTRAGFGFLRRVCRDCRKVSIGLLDEGPVVHAVINRRAAPKTVDLRVLKPTAA